MAGKPGCGRKSWDKELETKQLWKLATIVLIKALNEPDEKKVTLTQKIDISKAVFNKVAPTDVNVAGGLDITLKVIKDENIITTGDSPTSTAT
jgi:hypothetical protein